MNNDVFQRVRNELAKVEADHGVRVLYACESGSRAWGFASRDSDYDVRFIYVHRRDWYLSIEDRRDVIETQISDGLDISGWKLRKTLRLLRKSNPPLLEWLKSPVVYRHDPVFAIEFGAIASQFYSPRRCFAHYLHMALGNWRDYLCGRKQVRLKKYLYVFRPLLACRWIERGLGQVPMLFDELVALVLDEPDVREAIIGGGDFLVGGNRDVADGNQIGSIEQFQRHAALAVDLADDARGGLMKLELELGSTRGRAPRNIGSVELFEHDAFPVPGLELIEQRLLLPGHEGGFHQPDVLLLGRCQEINEMQVAVAIAACRHIFAVNAQQIKGVEDIPNGFTVDDEILGKHPGCLCDCFGNCHRQSQLVDAGDDAIVLLDQQTAAVVFLLHPPGGVTNEPLQGGFLDGIEQLAMDPCGVPLEVGVLIRGAVLPGGVSLGGFLPHQFIVDAFGLDVIHRGLGLDTGLQRGAATAVGEDDDVAAVPGFDCSLIDFVRAALTIVKSDFLHVSPFFYGLPQGESQV